MGARPSAVDISGGHYVQIHGMEVRNNVCRASSQSGQLIFLDSCPQFVPRNLKSVTQSIYCQKVRHRLYVCTFKYMSCSVFYRVYNTCVVPGGINCGQKIMYMKAIPRDLGSRHAALLELLARPACARIVRLLLLSHPWSTACNPGSAPGSLPTVEPSCASWSLAAPGAATRHRSLTSN